MENRTPALALMIIAGAMLLVCVLVMMRNPSRQAEYAATDPITYRIDPNTADFNTLCLLPRIGAGGLAQRIIDDRQANGPFHHAQDMARVSMIGDKTVEALSPWVRFDPPDTGQAE